MFKTIKAYKELNKILSPIFPDALENLNNLINQNMPTKFSLITPEIENRIAYELNIMVKANFVHYTMALYEIVNAIKEVNIFLWPHALNTGASFIFYCIGITETNPQNFSPPFELLINLEENKVFPCGFYVETRAVDPIKKYIKENYGENTFNLNMEPSNNETIDLFIKGSYNMTLLWEIDQAAYFMTSIENQVANIPLNKPEIIEFMTQNKLKIIQEEESEFEKEIVSELHYAGKNEIIYKLAHIQFKNPKLYDIFYESVKKKK